MSDRFAELLAKAQAGALTPEEVEEMARLVNAPLLEPLENPRPGFASKRDFAPSDVPGRLGAIDWFASCGEPASFDLSMAVERAESWAQTLWYLTDPAWGYVEMEAQNQLTRWLHEYDRDNYQNWNGLVVGHKEALLNRLSEEKWIPYQQAHGLDVAVAHFALWDALGALMENSYLGSGHRCFFFLELLTVYEAGHFPCGWRGEWPEGALVVF
jgi:hypothetical protein